MWISSAMPTKDKLKHVPPSHLQAEVGHALACPSKRGSALLAVLWLSLALSAIAFSLATTVHGESERASTAVDGVRSYYLATGAIERAILYIQRGNEFYSGATPVLRMQFPTGEAEVDVIP